MSILLVGDNKAEREQIAEYLRPTLEPLEQVSDISSAIRAIDNSSPDVVLVSLRAGQVSGLFKRLRARPGATRPLVIVVVEPSEIQSAISLGANDFLRRPVLAEELTARIMRGRPRPASIAGKHIDFGDVDLSRLHAFQHLGALVAEDFQSMLRIPIAIAAARPPPPGLKLMGAAIPMTFATEQKEISVSVLINERGVRPLGRLALRDESASKEAIEDVLRELANMAGGAFKRSAQQENLTVTTGLPYTLSTIDLTAERGSSRCWSAALPGGWMLGLTAEIRALGRHRVAAGDLKEGMVLAADVTNAVGALFARSGTRLTLSAANRIAQIIGPGAPIDVMGA
jgi:CheY-like chemotaxis protein